MDVIRQCSAPCLLAGFFFLGGGGGALFVNQIFTVHVVRVRFVERPTGFTGKKSPLV